MNKKYNNMEEQWSNIDELGVYQVSNRGRIKSFKNGRYGLSEEGKILNPSKDKHGYLLCKINGETKKIHQLVAISFLNHKPDGYKLVVDHIDNNKLNNKLDNLQLISARENTTKERGKYVGVSWSKSANKWRSRITVNGKSIYLGLFDNEYDARLSYQEKLKEIKNG